MGVVLFGFDEKSFGCYMIKPTIFQ